jgi:hypothetical protein
VPDSKPPLPKPKLSSHPVDAGLRTEGAILSVLLERDRDAGYQGDADVFLVYCPDTESL